MRLATCTVSKDGFSKASWNEQRISRLRELADKIAHMGVDLLCMPAGYLCAPSAFECRALTGEIDVLVCTDAAAEGLNLQTADLLANFVAASGMTIYDYAQPLQLRAAADLMEKYSDLPMDFADATLVLLGAELEVVDVLTLDRRGFKVFRLPRKRRFRLVLDEA